MYDHKTAELISTIRSGNIQKLTDIWKNDVKYIKNLQIEHSIMSKAVGSKNSKVVHYLIKNGVSTNEKNIDNRTPLHLAVALQYFDIIEILARNGADILATDYEGSTPLHIALQHGLVDTFKLLKEMCCIRKMDFKSKKSLMKIAIHNKAPTDIIESLLAEHMPINYEALCSAIHSGCHDTILLLIQNDPQRNTKYSFMTQNVLHIALSMNTALDTIEFLINQGANINMRSRHMCHAYDEDERFITPIQYAILLQREDVVRLLVDRDAQLNSNSDMPPALTDAIKTNQLSVVDLLVQHGAKLSTNSIHNITLLNHVIRKNFTDDIGLVRFVMNHCPNINIADSEGKLPIDVAINANRPEIIKLLLTNYADITLSPSYGTKELLKLVMSQKNMDLLDILLEHYEDESTREIPISDSEESDDDDDLSDGYMSDNFEIPYRSDTLIHLAVLSGDVSIVEKVLKRVKKIDVANSNYQTAVDIAIDKNDTPIILLLLHHGSRIRDDHLRNFIVRNQIEVVKKLIEFGYYDTVDFGKGNTALHVASSKNLVEMISLFLSHGPTSDALRRNIKHTTPLHLANISIRPIFLPSIMKADPSMETMKWVMKFIDKDTQHVIQIVLTWLAHTNIPETLSRFIALSTVACAVGNYQPNFCMPYA